MPGSGVGRPVYKGEPDFQLPGAPCVPGISTATVYTSETITPPAAICVLCSLLTERVLILFFLLTAIKTIRLVSP